MIDRTFLAQYAVKYETTLENILREYVQHLFLLNFYRQVGSGHFLFKGGTALRLIFGSPRFSQDLDFSGIQNSVSYERVIENTLLELSRSGIVVDIKESVQTTGGHIAILVIDIFDQHIEIMNQISFRHGSIEAENITVASDLMPPYTACILDKKILVAEKLQALLTRGKSRDFFDLYYILRKDALRNVLQYTPDDRARIINLITKQDKRKLEKDLRGLLPKSFWPVIKDLPTALQNQL